MGQYGILFIQINQYLDKYENDEEYAKKNKDAFSNSFEQFYAKIVLDAVSVKDKDQLYDISNLKQLYKNYIKSDDPSEIKSNLPLLNKISTWMYSNLKSQSAVLSQVDYYSKSSFAKFETDCYSARANLAQAGADVSVGIGYAEFGTPGTFSQLRSGGATFWLAGRLPFAGSAVRHPVTADDYKALAAGSFNLFSLGGSVEYSTHRWVNTGSATTPFMPARILGVWGGLEGRISSFLRFSGEVGYTQTKADYVANAGYSTSGLRWLGSINTKLALFGHAFWLGGTYGTANGNVSSLSDKTLLVTITTGNPKTASIFGAPPPKSSN